MGSSQIPALVTPPNSTFAKTDPWTSDFFVPANCRVILSSLEKLSHPASNPVKFNIKKKRIITEIKSPARAIQLTVLKVPAINELLNDS